MLRRRDGARVRAFAEAIGRADDVPPLTPPPPIRQNMELPQWSRPGVPMLLGAPPLPPSFIFGVRLNSPHSTTSVVIEQAALFADPSNRPRRSVSTIGRVVVVCSLAGPSGGPSRRNGR